MARTRGALLLGALAAAVVPVLAACDTSRVAATADVHISGRALDASGRPLAGARIQLFKEADLGEAVFGLVFAVGTLGAVCFTPVAPSICRSARIATAAGDGTFSYTLSGSDTQGSIGQASTLDVVVADPEGGEQAASTTLRFEAQSSQVTLPDARLWDAAARLGEASGRISVDWRALPAEDGRDTAYSVELDDSSRRALWSQRAGGTSAVVDSRVVEDVSGSAVALATANLGDTGAVQGVYASRRLAFPRTAAVPASRGRPCAAVSAPSLATTPQPTCGVTDGNLVEAAHLQGAPGSVVSGVVVDLGSTRPVSLVVPRGVTTDTIVEVSTDGAHYTTAATSSGGTVTLDLHGVRARYVRLRSTAGLDVSLMTELSVW
ncbi:MAG TPA: hypothetical protein VFO60_02940 [Candidatus Dormibacteraeota bacterium]|nr:hypothetical protein [Candidatus Dormibacteraeota bacterium]